MSEFKKHLYLILYPNESLVASELDPEAFGRHYSIGSPKHYVGKVIFAEVDINFRDDYFNIDEMLKQTTSGKPDVPKKTKFIASYRVLEHMDLKSILKLYLVTVDGQVLGIEPEFNYEIPHREDRIRIFMEICPINLLVASNLTPPSFVYHVVKEVKGKSAPKLFFTQLDIDANALLEAELFVSPLPNVNPSHLKACLKELKEKPDKRTKTISLYSNFDSISYAKIRHGYWIGDGDQLAFFKMPKPEELERSNYSWYRSVYKIYY
jgi:hypothetical protein